MAEKGMSAFPEFTWSLTDAPGTVTDSYGYTPWGIWKPILVLAGPGAHQGGNRGYQRESADS